MSCDCASGLCIPGCCMSGYCMQLCVAPCHLPLWFFGSGPLFVSQLALSLATGRRSIWCGFHGMLLPLLLQLPEELCLRFGYVAALLRIACTSLAGADGCS